MPQASGHSHAVSPLPDPTAIRRRLADCRVTLLGAGSLGSVVAEQLVRAGLGFLRLIDRDIVETANLSRQTLYDEQDAANNRPKAIAAARRLRQIDSSVRLDPIIQDVDAGNAEALLAGDAKPDLIVDATDNADTRYLLNDVAVKHGIPWVYGGCVAAEGRVMPIVPGRTPCLRCVFPQPPAAGELPTCDTAGLLGPAAAVVGSLQTVAAIKLLMKCPDTAATLMSFDLWKQTHQQIALGQPDAACPACGRRVFDFLDRSRIAAARLCGQNAVHIRPAAATQLDLPELAARLSRVGQATANEYVIRWQPQNNKGISVTIFPDGRATVHGTNDVSRAKSLYAQHVGH
jgi:adenylyltransferase/sulfurtransferase